MAENKPEDAKSEAGDAGDEEKAPKFVRGDYVVQVFLQYGNKFIADSKGLLIRSCAILK